MNPRAPIEELVATASYAALLPERPTKVGALVPAEVGLRLAIPIGDSLYLLVLEVLLDAESATRQILIVPALVDDGLLRRAVPGDGAAEALLARVVGENLVETSGVSCTSFPAARMARGERPLPVDQTHESVVVGEAAVVKWQVSASPTPAQRIVTHLSETGFTDMPEPWGFVCWNDDEADVLLASIAAFLPGATDGWDWMVADLSRYATGKVDRQAAVAPATEVGLLAGRLHVALATPSSAIPVTQRLATAAEREMWFQRASASLRDALASVDGETAALLGRRRRRVEAVFEGIRGEGNVTVIPVHGDFHVGQVLRWDGGYAVNDFDGNPVLEPQQRMAPEPAARDIAGMLQSIDHVGRVVLRRTNGADPLLVSDWIVESQRCFLASYRTSLEDAGASHLFDESLLLPFQVEQECREFIYAHRHLPRWGYVPAGAIQSLLP